MTSTNNRLTGERIKSLRTKLGMYQSDLANKIGVVRENISKYERGTVVPPSNVLNIIAATLNTSADYLLGNTENPAPVVDPVAEFDKDIMIMTDSELIKKYKAVYGDESIDDETFKRVLSYLRSEKRLKE